MAIDRERIRTILDEIGRRLTSPATICLIGSTPAIVWASRGGLPSYPTTL